MTAHSDTYLAIFIVVFLCYVVWCFWRRPNLDDLQPPSCYGSAPGPQQRAENDCDYCPWKWRCLGDKA